RVDLAVRGGRRFRVLDGNWDEGFLVARVEWLTPPDASSVETARLAAQVRQAFNNYLDTLAQTVDLRIERADLTGDPLATAYAICAMMPFDTAQRQRLLEAARPRDLLTDLLATLRRERELLLATGIGGAAIGQTGSRFSPN
ncbi:MAG: LON peptidase substrate-binding domain-containing protein, partial [Thermomicrobiales bacterium]